MTGFSLPGMVLKVSSASEVGAVRRINEDAVLPEPPMFVVADGMGGHAFGDRASAAAVAAVRAAMPADAIADPDAVLDAIRSANTAVRDLTAWAGDERVIAGTTLTGVAAVQTAGEHGPRWMVVNLGDSRVYAWDGLALERLTTDHSVVQELQDAGVIDEAQARVHPDRNVVTRALGAADEAVPDVRLLATDDRRTLLICSDGLTKELDDAAIAGLLRAGADAAALAAAAVTAGGHDNVSVILIRPEFTGLAVGDADEQTRDRELPLELDDTRPRV